MNKRGFIGTIVLLIVAFVLLKVWFDFDIFEWLNSPPIKSFFLKIWSIVQYIWNEYLSKAFRVIFNFINDLITRYL